jgi:hypothetical protein
MLVSNICPCLNIDYILYTVTADACSNAAVSNPTAADGAQLHNPTPSLSTSHNLPLFIFKIEMFSATYVLCILFTCPHCYVVYLQ